MRKLTFKTGNVFEVKGDGISIKVNGKEPTKEEIVLTKEEKPITIEKE